MDNSFIGEKTELVKKMRKLSKKAKKDYKIWVDLSNDSGSLEVYDIVLDKKTKSITIITK